MNKTITELQTLNLTHTVIAVSKYHTIEEIRIAKELGFTNFGENKLQDLEIKKNAEPNLIWHFIGRIQSNKLKKIVNCSDLIHSVSSIKQLELINKYAEIEDKIQNILLQVNIANDPSKDGFLIDGIDIEKFLQFPNINIRGIMVIAPHTDDQAIIEHTFRQAQILYENYKTYSPSIDTLSMGMSNDYHIALKYGSTHIRVGRLLFNNI